MARRFDVERPKQRGAAVGVDEFGRFPVDQSALACSRLDRRIAHDRSFVDICRTHHVVTFVARTNRSGHGAVKTGRCNRHATGDLSDAPTLRPPSQRTQTLARQGMDGCTSPRCDCLSKGANWLSEEDGPRRDCTRHNDRL